MATGSSPTQEVCSLFGHPVAGNPTQYMMERAFAHHGLDWRYLTFEVPPEQLADAVRGMRAMGFRGGNVTLPHKTSIVAHLDHLSESAALMGAVNCIVRDDDQRLLGDNTDGQGFVKSLAERCSPAGKRFFMLGAGGAARAIGVELARAGAAEISMANRTLARANELADLIRRNTETACDVITWEGHLAIPENADVLVNATSVGLGDADARLPVDTGSWHDELIVADVIPNPPRTWLLREAEERGCQTLDGLGMLVNQATIAFRLWTGIEPEPQVMREAVEEFLEI